MRMFHNLNSSKKKRRFASTLNRPIQRPVQKTDFSSIARERRGNWKYLANQLDEYTNYLLRMRWTYRAQLIRLY